MQYPDPLRVSRARTATSPRFSGTREANPAATRAITFGVRRFQVNSKVRQFAGLAGDKSSSMTGQPAVDAAKAIQGFAVELAAPTNRDAFDVGLVLFNESASIQLPLTKATDAVSTLRSLSLPCSGCTNVTAGLEQLERLVDQALAREAKQLRPVTLLFTDGGHNTGSAPEPVADRLKGKADLVCVAFGSADEGLLTRLATSPQHFYRCSDGASLRSFMASVGRTLSATIARGQNATKALSQL